MDVVDPSYFGRASFGKLETIEIASPGDSATKITTQCSHGQWCPPARLASFLPPEFAVPLTCYTGSDGLRRIVPGCNFEELIELGAVGGLAVMHGLKGFDPQVDHSYRAMQLIHQHVRGRAYRGTRGLQEHLTREFAYSRDLYIRCTGRLADSDRNVLPEHVGQSVSGEESRWSVTLLTKIGREAAVEAGYRNPVSQQAISFGLYEAARRNPLVVSSEQVPALIRLALFDIDGEEALSSELLQHVEERLLAAISEHLLDARDDFDQWFLSPRNTLVKQIAQQKSKAGGRLPREDVRRALLHLGWQAYGYVGPCIHALMRTIKNSLPALNDQEKGLFEHMHESQPYYGNLPAALLAERMPFLRRGVLATWNDPQNPVHVGVLHRLFDYYRQMVRARRAADQQFKRKGGAIREHQGASDNHDEAAGASKSEDSIRKRSNLGPVTQAGLSIGCSENVHAPPSRNQLFADIADHLRELHKIECPARCTQWDYRLEEETAEPLTIIVRSECQKVAKVIRMSPEAFAREAHKVLDP